MSAEWWRDKQAHRDELRQIRNAYPTVTVTVQAGSPVNHGGTIHYAGQSFQIRSGPELDNLLALGRVTVNP